jgi:hypothetical protein
MKRYAIATLVFFAFLVAVKILGEAIYVITVGIAP